MSKIILCPVPLRWKKDLQRQIVHTLLLREDFLLPKQLIMLFENPYLGWIKETKQTRTQIETPQKD